MAEPLNDFLEIVEDCINNPDMTYGDVGQKVCEAWEIYQDHEKAAGATTHDAHDYKGNPIRITIPEKG